MARPANSPSARIRQLEKALAKARKLPRGKRLSAEPMKDILGVSWPTLRDWCRDIEGFAESKVFEGGSLGVAYEFKPVATIQFLIKHFRKVLAAQEQQAKKLRKAVGGSSLEALPAGTTLNDIREIIKTNQMITDERVRQGQLVNRDEVKTALDEMMGSMQQAGVQASSEHDPTGQWPPEIAEAYEKSIRTIMSRMEQAARACIKRIDGSAAQR